MRSEAIESDPLHGRMPAGTRGLHGQRVRYYLALCAADLAGILIGFGIVGSLRFSEGVPYLLPFVGMTMVLFLLFSGRAYSAAALEDWTVGVRSAAMALLGAVSVKLIASYSVKSAEVVSRIWVGGSVVLTLLVQGGLRLAISRLTAEAFRNGTRSRLLILDGVDLPLSEKVDRFDATPLGLQDGGFHPLLLDDLAERIGGYDLVAVCCPPERRRIWANALQGCAMPSFILIPELDDIGTLGVDRFGGVAMVAAGTGTLNLRNRLAKRALDLGVTAMLLLVLAPLMLFTALAIRLDSPGPVLFRQERVGRGNRIFRVLKFRSMYHDRADGAGGRSASRGDDRVTRVGRFIRSTSIDELPQLLNVLSGEMSLVGPRPHALGSLVGNQLFWEVDPRYHHRHACKPGLTGLAQVRGFRGATMERADLVNRIDADLEYRAQWSVLRDLRIILATARVLVHRNAF